MLNKLKENKMKNLKTENNTSEMEEIKDLVDDLGWDYQLLTECGKATYRKLCNKLGWEYEDEVK